MGVGRVDRTTTMLFAFHSLHRTCLCANNYPTRYEMLIFSNNKFLNFMKYSGKTFAKNSRFCRSLNEYLKSSPFFLFPSSFISTIPNLFSYNSTMKFSCCSSTISTVSEWRRAFAGESLGSLKFHSKMRAGERPIRQDGGGNFCLFWSRFHCRRWKSISNTSHRFSSSVI